MQRKNNLVLGYFTVILKLSLGFITYPLVLHYLSSFELSIYFLFLTTTSLFELLDFSFSSNLIRFFSYASAGVTKIDQLSNPNNMDIKDTTNLSNADLYSNLLQLSKIYYKYLCIVCFIIIGGGFSIYLLFFTHQHNYSYAKIELSWILYSSASLLGIYFMYYSPLLIGKGYIDSVNKVSLISKLFGVVVQIITLFCGLGILSLAISALATAVTERFLLYLIIKSKNIYLNKQKNNNKNELWLLLKQIWHTNYKLGLMSLCWLFISKFNSFIAGLVINDISLLTNYLFTMQIIMILLSVAHVPISNNFSDISALYISNKIKSMQLFLDSNRKSILTMLFMLCGMLLFANYFLTILHLHGKLLETKYLFVVCLIYLLEKQLINHTTMITIRNEAPMYIAYLISAVAVLLLTLLFAFILHLGILSFILPQLIVQGSFNYWFWVIYNLKASKIKKIQYLRSLLAK